MNRLKTTRRVSALRLLGAELLESRAMLSLSPSAISGTAFLDANGDHFQHPREIVLSGVAATISGIADSGASVDLGTLTGRDGTYAFATVPPGQYALMFAAPAGLDTGGVAVDSDLTVLPFQDNADQHKFRLSIPSTAEVHPQQVNYAIPDISIRAFLASTPERVSPTKQRVTVSGLGNSTYIEGEAPVRFAEGIQIQGPLTQQLQSATVRLTNLLDADAERLAVDAANLGLAATYEPASGMLLVTGDSSIATYQNALRSLTYENVSDDPSPAERRVEVTVHGAAVSQAGVANISIEPVNDSPNLASIEDQTLAVGESLNLMITATDPEAADELTFLLDASQSPASARIEQVDRNAARIYWTPTMNDVPGPVRMRVLVTDSGTPAGADSEEFEVLLVFLDARYVDAVFNANVANADTAIGDIRLAPA